MVSIDAFAEQHSVSTRTVRRWLADGRIAGALQVGNKWALPADAIVSETLPGVMDTVKDTSSPAGAVARAQQPAQLTVAGILAPLPVMIPLDVAARVLGISEYAIRQHADYFELQRMGEHGSYVMPKRRLRELEG
jgi:hypothetical protein